jgi:hypothetical protein
MLLGPSISYSNGVEMAFSWIQVTSKAPSADNLKPWATEIQCQSVRALGKKIVKGGCSFFSKRFNIE